MKSLRRWNLIFGFLMWAAYGIFGHFAFGSGWSGLLFTAEGGALLALLAWAAGRLAAKLYGHCGRAVFFCAGLAVGLAFLSLGLYLLIAAGNGGRLSGNLQGAREIFGYLWPFSLGLFAAAAALNAVGWSLLSRRGRN